MQIKILQSIGGANLNLAPGDIVEVDGLAERFETPLSDEQLAYALCSEPAEDPRAAYVGDVPEPPAMDIDPSSPRLTAKERKALNRAAAIEAKAIEALSAEDRAALEALTVDERSALAELVAASVK